MKTKFGLIGKRLDYSFSKNYFSEKFRNLNLDGFLYENLEFTTESELAVFLLDEVYKYKGLNVTIPYKELIIPYLDELTETASIIGAVNTIYQDQGKLIGHNTDADGFIKAVTLLLKKNSHKKALIFGTGGASKAIYYALQKLDISAQFVSRIPNNSSILSYKNITKEILEIHTLLINTTPLGTFPDTNECVDIPYQYISQNHLAFDLIYNPSETLFMKKSRLQGAKVSNGLSMLEGQAESAWKIWESR